MTGPWINVHDIRGYIFIKVIIEINKYMRESHENDQNECNCC